MESIRIESPSLKGKIHAYGEMLKMNFRKHKFIYLMILPVIIFYVLFHYIPMYGAIIAFKDFSPAKGIFGSDWVGLKHFINFFDSVYFIRIVRNTFLINVYGVIFGFPAPIILALLLNEIRSKAFKRSVQTVTYLPHFISIVVICGMIINFTGRYGLINDIITFFGGERTNLLYRPEMFLPIYVISDIWQKAGWESIIYLAAISSIDQEQYQAAVIDGAGRWKQMWHITLAGLMPTIVILLILRLGEMMNVGFEKIILIYSDLTYETADVISSFVYRRGLLESNFSFSSAVGLFNSLINSILIVSANWISKRLGDNNLW